MKYGNEHPPMNEPLLINMGVSLVLVGIVRFWRGTPPINKLGLINRGSTLGCSIVQHRVSMIMTIWSNPCLHLNYSDSHDTQYQYECGSSSL